MLIASLDIKLFAQALGDRNVTSFFPEGEIYRNEKSRNGDTLGPVELNVGL